MTKRNEQYWKNRAAQRMWEYMQSAEETADEAAKFYQKAAAYLNQEIDGIFEKYMTKHNLSEGEAYELLNQMTDRASIQELLQKLQNGAKDTEKEQLIQKLEAPAYRARIERLEQIQSQLDQIMRNVYQQELALSTSHYAALVEEAYYKSIFDIQQRSGYGFSFAKVDQKMIERLLKSRWSGKNYSTRIWNNTGALAQTLKEELLVSLVTGRTERETAAIIMQKFAQGSSQARRLIRTESSYITGQMDLQSYDECGIEKYVYLATLDLRTCQEDCAPLDGKIFPVKDAKPGVNMPPMHPWCRCTTISYFSDEILRSLRRRARDPVTGKTYTVPGDMTYQKWMDQIIQNAQAYKPIIRGEEKMISIKPHQNIHTKSVKTYSEVYISDNAKIKRRALHTINKNTEDALKKWGIPLERKPKIVIVSPEEMPTAYGKYDAIQNTVFYIPQITDSKIVADQGNVEFHEMWHMKQAENFRNKDGAITKDNYWNYLKSACADAKKTIDRAKITQYNVSDISDYAEKMYRVGRYDEVEAEYMTLHRGR